MMSLKIFLDIASYDCLKVHLPHELMGQSAVHAAVMLGNTMVVECDEAQARDLLSVAQSYCPDAAVIIAGTIG